MDIILVVLIALHALSGVFWAGATWTVASLNGTHAERIFPFQMGAAGFTVLIGLGLWAYARGMAFGPSEQVLLLGIVAAVAAGAVLGNIVGRARRTLAHEPEAETRLRPRMALGNRIAAGLLVITVVCMVSSRFF
jgi:F0F1-type ATP synthase membrane subunit c/vacuolar-type H+-ATPase subunit K